MALDDQLNILMGHYDAVNTFYIRRVARQIRTIGELSPSSVHYLIVMRQMNADMAEITQQLASAAQMSQLMIYDIYRQALEDVRTDPRFREALSATPLSGSARLRLEQYVQAVAVQTGQTMQNLSNTTLTSASYRQLVDRAVLAVSSGMTDYRQATRNVLRELGQTGIQVGYPSGYHRRLDTAVRQNVLNGANQIAQNCSIMMGEELGYDAIEISAHARSAPDHEPVQGRVFLKAEFDKLQSDQPFTDVDGRAYGRIRRAIGEWNCMHVPMAFSTKYSKRKWTDEQLEEFKRQNHEGCEFRGKHLTLYQAGQLMRQIETKVRWEKDTAIAAEAAGDEKLRAECQQRINSLASEYSELAKASGIRPRKDRMSVEGFKPLKLPAQ